VSRRPLLRPVVHAVSASSRHKLDRPLLTLILDTIVNKAQIFFVRLIRPPLLVAAFIG